MASTKKVATTKETKQPKQQKKKVERKYLTATVIIAGIIELIDENGEIVYYRQRGINQIPQDVKVVLINKGMLNRYWANYKELPRHISISYEDEEVMGRASASFPTKQCMDIFGLSTVYKK